MIEAGEMNGRPREVGKERKLVPVRGSLLLS